jgi:hypothetical protein
LRGGCARLRQNFLTCAQWRVNRAGSLGHSCLSVRLSVQGWQIQPMILSFEPPRVSTNLPHFPHDRVFTSG